MLSEVGNINYFNFQGSTWCPSLMPTKLWFEVGGLSEEFDPGTASDTDLNMKLWKRELEYIKELEKA